MTRITHVIYDLDGTLLDTEPMFVEATNAIFARFGMALPEDVRALMMGRPTPVAVPLMLEHTGLPMSAQDFIVERDALLHERFPHALPRAGAQRLTEHLARRGVPQAVATSSSQRTLARKLLAAPAWFNTFAAVVSADDVARGKPAPDIFIEAARRLDAPPRSCLVFEDAPSGVEAALAAGMHVIALPEPGHHHRFPTAHATLAHFDDFDPAAWGLPPYPG